MDSENKNSLEIVGKVLPIEEPSIAGKGNFYIKLFKLEENG